MNTVLDALLIAAAILIGYRFGKRTTAQSQRVAGWFDGWHSGIRHTVAAFESEGLLATDQEVVAAAAVISAEHRDAQVRNARKGLQ